MVTSFSGSYVEDEVHDQNERDIFHLLRKRGERSRSPLGQQAGWAGAAVGEGTGVGSGRRGRSEGGWQALVQWLKVLLAWEASILCQSSWFKSWLPYFPVNTPGDAAGNELSPPA